MLIRLLIISKGDQVLKNACGTDNGGCSHLCLRSPKGYSCACPTGIRFKNESEPFPKMCNNYPDNFLVFATRTSISYISFDTPEQWDVALPVKQVQNSIAIDFHWEKKLIYYTDLQLDTIRYIWK